MLDVTCGFYWLWCVWAKWNQNACNVTVQKWDTFTLTASSLPAHAPLWMSAFPVSITPRIRSALAWSSASNAWCFWCLLWKQWPWERMSRLSCSDSDDVNRPQSKNGWNVAKVKWIHHQTRTNEWATTSTATRRRAAQMKQLNYLKTKQSQLDWTAPKTRCRSVKNQRSWAVLCHVAYSPYRTNSQDGKKMLKMSIHFSVHLALGLIYQLLVKLCVNVFMGHTKRRIPINFVTRVGTLIFVLACW